VGRGEYDLPVSAEQSHWIRPAAGGHSRVLAVEPAVSAARRE